MGSPTTKTTEMILAAATRRMRDGGFHDVSFRDIAADVGIKSASVHHHFPTKDDLGAAVVTAYTERFVAALGDPANGNSTVDDLLARYVGLFRASLRQDRQMCLCGILGSELQSLPAGVQHAARQFFQANIAWLETVLARKSPHASKASINAQALRILATLQGAMLISHTLGDDAAFDAVAQQLTT